METAAAGILLHPMVTQLSFRTLAPPLGRLKNSGPPFESVKKLVPPPLTAQKNPPLATEKHINKIYYRCSSVIPNL